ncbi:MAG TPA: hypothetical protein DC054_11285 [Blastocatellia bacterium]|nr:hypothetical protein [Blastocatellia bacterium]
MINNRKPLISAGMFVFLAFLSVLAQIDNVGTLNTWTTKPFSRAHNSSNQATYIKVVRAAKQTGSDRVVFEFEGPFPNYRIEYLKSPFYESEAGRQRIRQPGNVFVQINFFVIPTGDEQLKFTEAKNFVPKGRLMMPSLQSVKDKVLFEGYYDFLMGVSSRKPYRVTELSNPSRLVIDFKH